MPIHGLSEARRMPRVGKLRLGIKATSKKTGNQFPKAVDYFVCNADASTSAEAAQAFRAVYGDKPRSVDIMFPTDDMTQFFPQFYRRYGSGSGLLCKGDGITANAVDPETGEFSEIDCCPPECEWAAKQHCRPVGTLMFMMPKVPGLGCWQIDTSSVNSIINLNSAIDFIKGLTGGRIAGIPLRLVVKPKEVQVEGRKKVVYVLDLAHDQLRLADVLQASQQTLAQLLLPAPNLDEIPDDLYPSDLVEASQQATRAIGPVEDVEQDVIDAEASVVPMTEAADEPSNNGPDNDKIDGAIEAMFDQLGFPPAKRTLYRHYNRDKNQLLDLLMAEAEGEITDYQPAPQEARQPSPKGSENPGPAPAASQAGLGRLF